MILPGLAAVAGLLLAGGRGRRARFAAVALVGWTVVAGSYVTALSIRAGEPSIGTAPRLNYGWNVAGTWSPEGTEGAVRVAVFPVEPGITHSGQYDPTLFTAGALDVHVPGLQHQADLLARAVQAFGLIAAPALLPLLALLLVTPRYIAPYLALGAVTVLIGSGVHRRRGRPRDVGLFALAGVLVLATGALVARDAVPRGPADAEVARRLRASGVRSSGARWALYIDAPAAVQGAWRPVSGTRFHILPLTPPAPPTDSGAR